MISLGTVPLYSFLDLSNYCLFPHVPTPFPIVSQASARTRPFDPYLKPIQDMSRQLIFNLCRYIESEGDREGKCYSSQKRCTLPWYSSCLHCNYFTTPSHISISERNRSDSMEFLQLYCTRLSAFRVALARERKNSSVVKVTFRPGSGHSWDTAPFIIKRDLDKGD